MIVGADSHLAHCLFVQFTPTAGPTKGGTNIIIRGENLGANIGHVSSVWIGEVVCRITGYTPGRQLVVNCIHNTSHISKLHVLGN